MTDLLQPPPSATQSSHGAKRLTLEQTFPNQEEQFQAWYHDFNGTLTDAEYQWRCAERLAATIEIKEEPFDEAPHLSEDFDDNFAHANQMSVHEYTASMTDLIGDTRLLTRGQISDIQKSNENDRGTPTHISGPDSVAASGDTEPLRTEDFPDFLSYHTLGPIFGTWRV
jgi:hypothetical protein